MPRGVITAVIVGFIGAAVGIPIAQLGWLPAGRIILSGVAALMALNIFTGSRLSTRVDNFEVPKILTAIESRRLRHDLDSRKRRIRLMNAGRHVHVALVTICAALLALPELSAAAVAVVLAVGYGLIVAAAFDLWLTIRFANRLDREMSQLENAIKWEAEKRELLEQTKQRRGGSDSDMSRFSPCPS